MPSRIALGLLFLCPLVTSATTRAAEMVASGLSMPVFDAAGKPTHKLFAKTATKSGAVQVLKDVEIHFFSPKDASVVVQKLQADEATWDDRKETLVGRGRIAVETEVNRLSGEGFDFTLATSLLHIHRNFKMENREVVITSDRATVDMLIEKTGDEVKVRDVKRCEANDNLQIVVLPTATKDYGFRKAFSEVAIYDGATQFVTMPKPVRLQLEKNRTLEMNHLELDLREAGNPIAKP